MAYPQLNWTTIRGTDDYRCGGSEATKKLFPKMKSIYDIQVMKRENRQGNVVKRFAPVVKSEQIADEIAAVL